MLFVDVQWRLRQYPSNQLIASMQNYYLVFLRLVAIHFEYCVNTCTSPHFKEMDNTWKFISLVLFSVFLKIILHWENYLWMVSVHKYPNCNAKNEWVWVWKYFAIADIGISVAPSVDQCESHFCRNFRVLVRSSMSDWSTNQAGWLMKQGNLLAKYVSFCERRDLFEKKNYYWKHRNRRLVFILQYYFNKWISV